MNFQNVEFLISAASPKDFPKNRLPEIAFAGKSNVGKSSLINSMLNDNTRSIGDFSEKLGRGRHETREVEFININGAYVADSPGFSRLDIKVELTSFARIFKDFNNG